MVVYNKGEFMDEEPDRRSVRDEEREKFFAKVGGERLKDPFSFEPDPAAQLELVQKLMAEALDLHNDDKQALSMLQSLVPSSAIGIPSLGASSMGRPKLETVMLSAFGEFFNLKNH
jgi:hypothetical protein